MKTCEIALPLHRRAYAVLGRGSNIDTEIWEAFGMKVSFEKIKEIVTGVSYVEKQDAYIQFHRFNKAEEAYYKDAEFPRHFATSGVRLEFETNSETLKLKVHTKKATPALYFSHDILLNGKKIGDIANFDTLDAKTRKPVGEFHLGDFEGEFVLGSGIKQVSILFPWSVNSMLETLEIDDGATIYATKKTKKLIAYGDSISYGASCAYPSGRYVSRLSDALGAEEVCKAIGGEVFCPGLVALADEAEADCVTVAYGTNDITSRDVEDIERRCSEFFAILAKVYAKAPVFVISPIWRSDCNEGEISKKLRWLENYLCETVSKYENFVFINGFDLIPHNTSCYADFIHPNDLGFAHYASHLVEIVSKEI